MIGDALRAPMCPHRRSLIFAAGVVLALAVLPASSIAGSVADPRIEAMKIHPRGPFSRIRWFCNDGTVLASEAGACDAHGGGMQHGAWSEATLALRDAGYRIATVYADLDIDRLLAGPRVDRELAQMVIERFLLRFDNGWILRRARHYRGALQAEDERAQANRLLLSMATADYWTSSRYLAWRTLAARLPHGSDNSSAQTIRQDASMLAGRDPRFVEVRNRIHISPAAHDGATVRAYAEHHSDPELAAELHKLASDIDAFYAIDTVSILAELAIALGTSHAEISRSISNESASLGPSAHPASRLTATATLLRVLRDALKRIEAPALRLTLLDASQSVEAEHFVAATEMSIQAQTLTRAQQLRLLAASVDALYGVGLLSLRQHAALAETFGRLDANIRALPAYRQDINYLGLAPGWADRHLNFVFADGMAVLAEIEPLAEGFIQDHLRGSPMFFYAALIDRLVGDANQLAGVRHRLFERVTGVGLRALNPGIARGILRDGRALLPADFKADGIYLLPETIAELPPVAGIITAGEGNPLSHVQLLARNLGIPNVSVGGEVLQQLAQHEGERVVLAVSAGATVHLLSDNDTFDPLFKQASERSRNLIEPDLDKLDLVTRDILDLADLRASDSGRTVGPKAAKLGELKAHYPDAVAAGLALPFGIFRELLEQPALDGSTTMFRHIVSAYRALESLPAGSAARATQTEQLRARIERWLTERRLPDDVQLSLRDRLINRLGKDGSFGVFVRSDTNVEDLPGFTGAGLNLTVPNVVGIDNIIAAIPRVWASPFTARAFSWRQALMREPEHVYPAVLLLESVNAAKSGVLVTQDIDNGDREWLSVAVNEGVGGAVDGQSAESLRIHLGSANVRLLAQASASLRRQISPDGGVSKLPASGADAVLAPAEIAQLIAFARALPEQFPAIVDADGEPAPADVEFGFENGELRLFQIRPFLDNAAARGNRYLIEMDPDAQALAAITVDLDAVAP